MYPLCIVDILRNLKAHTVDHVHRVETAQSIKDLSLHHTHESQAPSESKANSSMLSGVSSMFSSMFSYLIEPTTNDDDGESGP